MDKPYSQFDNMNGSQQQQVQYGRSADPHEMQPQVVVQQPMTTFMTNMPEPQWSWCHLVTSVISIFCCQIFGFIAIVMSLMSYTDHRVKDFERFRGKKSCALGFAIAGIVIGCATILIAIIAVATITAAAVNSAESMSDSFDPNNNNWGN